MIHYDYYGGELFTNSQYTLAKNEDAIYQESAITSKQYTMLSLFGRLLCYFLSAKRR